MKENYASSTPSISDLNSTNATPTEIDSVGNDIHSNPKVIEAIKDFENGEKLHTIGKCKICYEIQPIFNFTKQVDNSTGEGSNISTNKWKIKNNDTCERCHKEIALNQRKKESKIPKFSGMFSEEMDIHHTASDIIKHNNMHFDAIPPNLQNLTTLETALISKISVIMKVTVLKYGMLCGKGHSIGIPNEMKIATTLPLLPKEVGIVVLKKKGDNSIVKEYTVSRKKVQDALECLFWYTNWRA